MLHELCRPINLDIFNKQPQKLSLHQFYGIFKRNRLIFPASIKYEANAHMSHFTRWHLTSATSWQSISVWKWKTSFTKCQFYWRCGLCVNLYSLAEYHKKEKFNTHALFYVFLPTSLNFVDLWENRELYKEYLIIFARFYIVPNL